MSNISFIFWAMEFQEKLFLRFTDLLFSNDHFYKNYKKQKINCFATQVLEKNWKSGWIEIIIFSVFIGQCFKYSINNVGWATQTLLEMDKCVSNIWSSSVSLFVDRDHSYTTSELFQSFLTPLPQNKNHSSDQN